MSETAKQAFLKKLTGLNMGDVNSTVGMSSGLPGTPMTPGGSRIPWTTEEDEILREAVARHKGKNWKCVAAALSNRTRAQCAHRWQKVLNPTIKKGAWSPEEDEMLQDALKQFGCGKWSRVSKLVPGRNGKQCRERWHNHLKPDVNKEPWSTEEDQLIVKLRNELGNKWAAIARELPGRTENAVKNRWNAKLALDCGAVSHGTPRAFSKGFARSTPRGPRAASPLSSASSSLSFAGSSAAAKAAAIAAAAAVEATSTPTAAALASFSASCSSSPMTASLGPKRASSLMSLISQLSGGSVSAPSTPPAGMGSEPALKRLKVDTLPTVGPLPSLNLEALAKFAQNHQGAAASNPPLASKFDALNPQTFTLGTFQKTQLSATPQASAAGPHVLSSALSDLEWLASIASAQAIASSAISGASGDAK